MRFLVCDSSYHVREGFLTSLLSTGYEVVVIKDKKQILPSLGKMPFSVMVLDVSEDDLEMLELIKVLRTDSRYEDTKIFVHVLNPSKQFIIDMLKIGIVGYLLKPFNKKDVLNRLRNILDKAGVNMPQITHVYFRLNESQSIGVSFRSFVTHRMVHGIVTAIAVDGASFVLDSDIGYDEIEVNQIINNFQMKISTSIISGSAMVTSKNNSEITITFHKISDSDITILCKHVYRALTGLSIDR